MDKLSAGRLMVGVEVEAGTDVGVEKGGALVAGGSLPAGASLVAGGSLVACAAVVAGGSLVAGAALVAW